jgi:hypothetical protein
MLSSVTNSLLNSNVISTMSRNSTTNSSQSISTSSNYSAEWLNNIHSKIRSSIGMNHQPSHHCRRYEYSNYYRTVRLISNRWLRGVENVNSWRLHKQNRKMVLDCTMPDLACMTDLDSIIVKKGNQIKGLHFCNSLRAMGRGTVVDIVQWVMRPNIPVYLVDVARSHLFTWTTRLPTSLIEWARQKNFPNFIPRARCYQRVLKIFKIWSSSSLTKN